MLWKPKKLAVLSKHHRLGQWLVLPMAGQNNSESELLSSGEGRARVGEKESRPETQGIGSATRSSAGPDRAFQPSDIEPALSCAIAVVIRGSTEMMKEALPGL